jgi:hypothetical protein
MKDPIYTNAHQALPRRASLYGVAGEQRHTGSHQYPSPSRKGGTFLTASFMIPEADLQHNSPLHRAPHVKLWGRTTHQSEGKADQAQALSHRLIFVAHAPAPQMGDHWPQWIPKADTARVQGWERKGWRTRMPSQTRFSDCTSAWPLPIGISARLRVQQ